MVVTLLARTAVIRRGASSGSELSLYQLALLAGGRTRASDTALAYLVWSGLVEVRESTDRLVRVVGRQQTLPDLHPIELAALESITAAGVRPEAAMASSRRAAGNSVVGLTGLVVAARTTSVLDVVALGGTSAVIVGAVWWIAASTITASGLVLLLALSAALYAGWWLATGRPRTTLAGQEALEQVRMRYDDDLQIAAIGVTSLPMDRAMNLIAIYGRDALTGGLSGLRKVMTGSPAPVLMARSSLGP